MNFKINIGNFSFKGQDEQVELSDVNVEVEDLRISEIGELISTLKDTVVSSNAQSEVKPFTFPTDGQEPKRLTQAMATLKANNERRRQRLADSTKSAPAPVEEPVVEPVPTATAKQDNEARVESEGGNQHENGASIPPFFHVLMGMLSEPTPGCDCENCQAKRSK